MGKYNTTQLYIDKAAERGIVHRDYIAHSLRWTHILKYAKMGQSILDVGCGINTPLLMAFYTNKFRPSLYMGLDYRKDFRTKASDFKFPVSLVGSFDACNEKDWSYHFGSNFAPFDIVCCLEVIEHMPKENGILLLENLSIFAGQATIFMSTPCFNGSAAANHIYEWRYDELRTELENYFNIDAVYGTFASQRDIIPYMSEEELGLMGRLKKYYDSNFLAIIFAPLHPYASRNCIWRMRAK